MLVVSRFFLWGGVWCVGLIVLGEWDSGDFFCARLCVYSFAKVGFGSWGCRSCLDGCKGALL